MHFTSPRLWNSGNSLMPFVSISLVPVSTERFCLYPIRYEVMAKSFLWARVDEYTYVVPVLFTFSDKSFFRVYDSSPEFDAFHFMATRWHFWALSRGFTGMWNTVSQVFVLFCKSHLVVYTTVLITSFEKEMFITVILGYIILIYYSIL